jgi:hypothetical protein
LRAIKATFARRQTSLPAPELSITFAIPVAADESTAQRLRLRSTWLLEVGWTGQSPLGERGERIATSCGPPDVFEGGLQR